jgi:phenylacetate-coenzyme A ligase PaaK-like adenylate-forming protein
MPGSDLLFAPREAIEAERERCFAEMMDLVAVRHPRTRRCMAAAGLARADFASLADLARLPPTLKSEYMADPDAFRLDAEALPQEMRTVWDVMYTTGTSAGRPTPFVSTTYDFFRILEANRNMLRLRGVRPDDVIANLFPLTAVPHGAFIRAMHAAASMNLRVVAALPGNPSPYFTLGADLDRVVEIVARSGASVLWGVTSFVRRVLAHAAETGADFSAVRLAFVTGEGVSEPVREALTAQLRRLGRPDAWVSVSYGATEMQGGMVECAPGSGLHNPAPDQFYVEVVDPETHAPLPEGASGLVLLTHLRRRGTVLLRYALGDVSALGGGRCPHCGSSTDRLIAMPRRMDGLLKIKGTLVNPQVLAEAAEATLGVREFQFTIEEERFAVKIAAPPDGALEKELIESVKRACGVSPRVEFVAPGDFAGAWKLKRVLDLRR